MENTFFAAISRMKYIERWALMRSARPENLCEHSMEVAMIAHALCVIGNTRFGKELDAGQAAVMGLFHDASEIITGDMPTPVKYYSEEIRQAYHHVEDTARGRLLQGLPEDLRPVYEGLLYERTPGSAGEELTPGTADGETELPAAAGAAAKSREAELYLRRIVKAADKFSALIKCMEEARAGNTEFETAMASTKKKVEELCRELPEAEVFAEEFLPSYGRTLDELL